MTAPRLLAYALARTGGRATAEYIAQDALTALVRRWRASGPPSSPDAYLFAIATRRAGRAVARRALMGSLDTLRGVVRDEPGIERSYEDRAELQCAWDFDPERELRVMGRNGEGGHVARVVPA